MMYPWVLALRLSVYLRRQWGISHFTVCIPLYLIPLIPAFADTRMSVFGKVLVIGLAVAVVWIFTTRARLHNKPANVSSVIPIYFSMFIVGWVLIEVLFGSNPIIALCSASGAILASTPGFKVPHEPDNLNYAPEGA